MRSRWAWFGAGGFLLLAVVIVRLVWAGTAGTPAFVDETGRIVPAMTQARPMYIPAAVCVGTTPGSVFDLTATVAAVPTCLTGTNVQGGTLDFAVADGSNVALHYHYRLPSIWTGNVDVVIEWLSPTTTGSVVWQLQGSCVANGQTVDQAFGTVLALTSAVSGTTTAKNSVSGTLLPASHLSTCAPGELLNLKLFRDSGHASDTMAGTARLLGIELMIRLTFS